MTVQIYLPPEGDCEVRLGNEVIGYVRLIVTGTWPHTRHSYEYRSCEGRVFGTLDAANVRGSGFGDAAQILATIHQAMAWKTKKGDRPR